MNIEEREAETHITLSDHTGTRAKVLFSFEAIVYIVGAVGMLFTLIGTLREVDLGALFFISLGGAIAFSVAFWRYLSRVTQREELVIQPNVLIIITIVRGKRSAVGYPIDSIKNLHYIGFEKPIDHPLKSETFDYFGFQTQQEVVNSVMAEGNIGFEYEGKQIRFGIGVPSWDAALLSALLTTKSMGLLTISGLPEEILEHEWNR